MHLWEKMVNDRVRVYRTANLYLAYVCMGLSVSIPGPTLPDIQANVGGTTSDMGYIVAAKFGAACFGSIVAGFLFQRFNRLFLLSTVILCVGLTNLAIPFQKDLSLLILVMVCSGIMQGAVLTGGDCLCLDLWASNPGPAYHALQFSFSVGSVLGPLLAEPFLSGEDEDYLAVANSTEFPTTTMSQGKRESNISVAFSIVSALTFAVAASTLISFFVDRSAIQSNCEKKRDLNQAKGKFLPRCLVIFGMVFIGAYISFENNFAQFLTTFVTKSELNMTKSQGSFMTSVFYGTSCCVRGCSIYISTKLKPWHNLIINLIFISISATVLSIFGTQHPAVMWIGTATLGLGAATCYPSNVSWMETYVGINNWVIAFFAISASLATLVMSLLISRLMEYDIVFFLYGICFGAAVCISAFGAQCLVVNRMTGQGKSNMTNADSTAALEMSRTSINKI